MKRKRDSSTYSLRDPLSNLLEFCSQSNLVIDPRLQIDYDDLEIKTIGVFLRAERTEEDIAQGTTVVRIPKTSVLSVKSSGLAKHLDKTYELAPYGLQAQLELALAVYLEDSKGSSSPWYLYLKSLPEKLVDLPMFWDIEVGGDEQRNEDVKVALKWMQGTDIQRQLIPLKDVKIFFHEIVVPAMTSASTKPSLHAFYRAFSLVSSRAFIVDAYHGLAMVPVADAFNHIRDNQVHLESAFDVCPDCGSLRQCIHDRENERNEFEPTSLSTEEDEEELYYTMATTTYIPMGIGGTRTRTEIFNTYGSHLSNAQLLNQYGFILDANEADFISFDVEGVLRVLEVRTEMDVRKVWMERLNGVKEEVGETEVLYVSEKASDLRINSDGRITIGLFFLLCVAVGVVDDQGLKQLLEAGGSEGERGDHGQEIAPLARSIVTLCEHRLGELTQDDVGEMLDDISPSYWRTRTVGMHVMAEQAMLRSCISYWEEYLPE